MSLLRKKQGYSLVEIMLSLAIGGAILISAATWGLKKLNEAKAKNNEQTIMLTLSNINDYLITNASDGTSKTENPINNNIAVQYEMFPLEVVKSGDWLTAKDLGSFQIAYATDYPNSNVIEFRIKDIDRATCSRLISQLPSKVLELKVGNKYLPHSSKIANGVTEYTPNIGKSVTLCDEFLKSSDKNSYIAIRYFSSPDMVKVYNIGGDLYGSVDSTSVERKDQIEKFKQAFTYTYGIRENHIKTNISN